MVRFKHQIQNVNKFGSIRRGGTN